jgi:serine/threonine protein kinase
MKMSNQGEKKGKSTSKSETKVAKCDDEGQEHDCSAAAIMKMSNQGEKNRKSTSKSETKVAKCDDEGQEHEMTKANKYCIQMGGNLGKTQDWFEGFVNKSGKRDGKGRFQWADGTVGICNWNNGHCGIFEQECKKRSDAERLILRKDSSIRKKIDWKSFSSDRKTWVGMCVECGELCSNEFTFKCLNCETAYCERCEEKVREEGFKRKRPPCRCLVDRYGVAVQNKGHVTTWKPRQIVDHRFKKRQANSKIEDLIFKMEFERKGRIRDFSTTLMDLGQLSEKSRSEILSSTLLRQYVEKTEQPKPKLFMELEQRWKQSPQLYPKISLNTEEIRTDWMKFFKETTEDIDSLDVKSFYLTYESINQDLPELLQRRQVEIGTGWSAVNPREGHCIICGPRPTLIVYMGKLNVAAIRKSFAKNLTANTGKHFTTAKSGKSIFQQSNASVDVSSLMTAWLTTVTSLQEKDQNADPEIEKMKYLQIIYHGWKSEPDQIVQFDSQNSTNDELELWDRCKEDNENFEATFDLAQKYLNKDHKAIKQDSCMSKVRIPIFAMTTPIPGFTAKTWSMFGPLPPGDIDTGSIMLDRIGNDSAIFPENVKRVKIYPGYVNFLKHFMNKRFNGKNLTKKQLNSVRKKFEAIQAEIANPKCMDHLDMMMSFRIEFTMALNSAKKTLNSLREQLVPLKKNILQKLQPHLKLTMIALEDIQTFSMWCLSRYKKICKGESNTPFGDQSLAKDLVLSLWHSVGYRQFRFTQNIHKTFLVDLDMSGYDTEEEIADDTMRKQRQPREILEWDPQSQSEVTLVIQALHFMNIQSVEVKTNQNRLRYHYRRICDARDEVAACPWCYSAIACKKIAENPEKINLRKKGNYACKSNDFATSIELANDVYGRLKYHRNIYNNDCDALVRSIFFAANEKTQVHKRVLKDMAQKLKQQIHEFQQHNVYKEFLEEFDKSESQEAPNLTVGHAIEKTELNEQCGQAIMQALQYMNIFKPKKAYQKKTDSDPKKLKETMSISSPLQYMYKKVCDVQIDCEPCPWCYSKAKCIAIKQNPQKHPYRRTNTACKSNIFETLENLIDDVHGRLKHHIGDSWNGEKLQHIIEAIFFKSSEENADDKKALISAIQSRMVKQKAAIVTREVTERIQKDHVMSCRNDEQVDVYIDDERIDALCQDAFDSMDEALMCLCTELQLPMKTLPSTWQKRPWKMSKSKYIVLKDCVYTTTPFAQGNATCHFAWNPKTQKPMCIKLLTKDVAASREAEMLAKLMKMTSRDPGKHYLVQYQGFETKDRQHCLKFELVHPAGDFRSDLAVIEQHHIVAYMKALLTALAYLHENCNIVHGDVKPGNFVHHFESNTFRLIDFGSATFDDVVQTSKNKGTRGFKAPEMLHQTSRQRIKKPVDVWSAGIIMMSLITGRKDILSREHDQMASCDRNAKHLEEIGNIVGKHNMKKLNIKEIEKFGDAFSHDGRTGWAAKALQLSNRRWNPSEEALDLLSKMLDVCPQSRITSSDALAHKFFKRSSAKQNHDSQQLMIGVSNGADRCSLHSVLQCLKHTKELVSAVDSTSNTHQLWSANKYYRMVKELRNVLITSGEDVTSAMNLLQREISRVDASFNGDKKLDASKVCELLLRAMLSAYATQNPVDAFMENALKITKVCESCGRMMNSPKQNFIVKLEVPSNHQLQFAIDHMLQTEILDKECEYCHKRGVRKTLDIALAPKLLILQFKIFEDDFKKCVNPITSQKDVPVKLGSYTYQLFAVISHHGNTMGSGHYVAYTEMNGTWACFDEHEAKSHKHWQNENGRKKEETPYIFFLRKLHSHETNVEADGAVLSDPCEKGVTKSCANTTTLAIHEENIKQSACFKVGNNVLARLDESQEWAMAILMSGRKDDMYEAHFVEKRETGIVKETNIKQIEWQYWKGEMQSWTCEDFKVALVEWETPADWMIKTNFTALEDCQIGTVIAQYSGCKKDGNMIVGHLNSTRDFNCQLLWVPNPDTRCIRYSATQNESVSAFLVTTTNVEKGQQLTWFSGEDGEITDVSLQATEKTQNQQALNIAGNETEIQEQVKSNSEQSQKKMSDLDDRCLDAEMIAVGKNVLARLERGGNWILAIVETRSQSNYVVHAFSMNKTLTIHRNDIKIVDWVYWKKEFRSWSYANFKDALVQWNKQVGAKSYPEIGRGLEALEDCQIGTVVAEYSGLIAHKSDGMLYMGGLYPEMDECMQQNCSVRSMQNEEWKSRKNHCVTMGRCLGARFCIDGYATTCSTLDKLPDHGGVGWGAILNAAKKNQCNCTLVWVARPDICCVDKLEHLQQKECVAAFLVTHKIVYKGEQLTWYYKDASFYF